MRVRLWHLLAQPSCRVEAHIRAFWSWMGPPRSPHLNVQLSAFLPMETCFNIYFLAILWSHPSLPRLRWKKGDKIGLGVPCLEQRCRQMSSSVHPLCAKGEGYGIPLHHLSISTAIRTATAVIIFMGLLEKRQQRFP